MANVDTDPQISLKAMCGVLDLLGKEASAASVDDFLFAQHCIRDFAHALMIMDEKVLRLLPDKPVGVYGKKDDVVWFLSTIESINDSTAEMLLDSQDEDSEYHLPSGLYIVRSPRCASDDKVFFLVYWPEDTTWNDDATASAKRERVKHFQFIKRFTDEQCFSIHAKDLVERDELDLLGDDFDFGELAPLLNPEIPEVSIGHEPDENIVVRPGFEIVSSFITEVRNSILDPFVPPRLLAGETMQGILTAKYIPPPQTFKVEPLRPEPLEPALLRQVISAPGHLRLSENLSERALQTLVDNGLQSRFPTECNNWKALKTGDALLQRNNAQIKENLKKMEDAAREAVLGEFCQYFPQILGLLAENEGQRGRLLHRSTNLRLHPRISILFQIAMEFENLSVISSQQFQTLKTRSIAIDILLRQHGDLKGARRHQLIDTIWRGDFSGAHSILNKSTLKSKLMSRGSASQQITGFDSFMKRWLAKKDQRAAFDVSDVQFLANLAETMKGEPILERAGLETIAAVEDHLDEVAGKLAKRLSTEAVTILQDERLKSLRVDLIHRISDATQEQGHLARFVVDDLLVVNDVKDGLPQVRYRVTGRRESPHEPVMEYKMHMMGWTADQRRSHKLDPLFTPPPQVDEALSHSFRLPVCFKILHSQLLEDNRCLLIFEDLGGVISVFVERIATLGSAISRQGFKHQFHRGKLGPGIVMAFDESQRMLAVCGADKLLLQLFCFDPDFTSLQALGLCENLAPWYKSKKISIRHACFVCDSQEILLVDTSANARIFSWATRTFQSASLQLSGVPTAVYSSPDSSCFVLSIFNGSAVSVQLFFWDTFGATKGTVLELPPLPSEGLVLTSVFDRWNLHLMCLEVGANKCRSFVLDVGRNDVQPTFYCGICLEDHLAEDVATVDMCGHMFCRDGVRNYISSKLNERRYPISCPSCHVAVGGQDEPGIISETLAQLVGISEEEYTIWIELELLRFSVVIYCRKCEKSVAVDRVDHEITVILHCPMPGCTYRWCKACQQEVLFEDLRHTCDGTLELDNLISKEGWKRCPGMCKMPTQKISGCNHMTCGSPGCNTHFCYQCGAVLSVTGGHTGACA